MYWEWYFTNDRVLDNPDRNLCSAPLPLFPFCYYPRLLYSNIDFSGLSRDSSRAGWG